MAPFWESFLSNALATFLGAIVGVPIALWLSGYQNRRTEKEKRKKILSLLKTELEYDQGHVSDWLTAQSPRAQTGILAGLLKDELWRAFSDGGELQWIKDISILDELSSAYDLVRAIRYLAEKHFDSVQFLTRGNSPSLGEGLLLNLRNACESFVNVYSRTALESKEDEVED